MTPAPPNNPGHQEAQGRRRSTNDPIQGGDCCFPNGHSSAESGFCHEPQCSGDTVYAATVLNALDALLGATGKQSYVVIDYFRAPRGATPSVAAMIVSDGKPVLVRGGFSVLEALKNLVR